MGSIFTIGIFSLLNLRRTKRLTRNAEDLHGSARWANPKDVKATGLIDTRQGVYVGGWYDDHEKRLYYLRHNGPKHVLAFAPTRTGKGVGLVIPTLLAWSESAVIYDIKGENWAKTAGYRYNQGHLCFKFSPVEQHPSRFNPLAEIRLGTPRDVSDAQNVGDMIVRTGQDSPQERYWQDAAASIATGMILHVCYAAAAEGRVASLGDLAGVFTRPGSGFRDTLNELLNYPHDPEYVYRWRTPDHEPTATHPVVREKVQEMLDKEDKDFSGVLSTAKTALAHVRVAYAPNQYDTAELLSKMTGSTTVQKATFNFSGSRLSPVMNHVNASVDQVERPLITPDEVMRLRPAKKEGQGASEQITAPGDMLIFVAGHYPIYGTQMLYFSDPVLRKRAALAPPLKLITLVNGKPAPQLSLERTNHVISRAETDNGPYESGEGVSSSLMEQEFALQLSRFARHQSISEAPFERTRSRPPISEAYIEELESARRSENTSKTEKEL